MAAGVGSGGGQLYHNDENIQSQPYKHFNPNVRVSQHDTVKLTDMAALRKEIEIFEQSQKAAQAAPPKLEGHVTKEPAVSNEKTAKKMNNTWMRVTPRNTAAHQTPTFSPGQQKVRGGIPTEWMRLDEVATVESAKPPRNPLEAQNLETMKKFNSLDDKGQYLLKVRTDDNGGEHIEFAKVDHSLVGTLRSKLKGSNPQEVAKDVARVLSQAAERATPDEQATLLDFVNYSQTAKMPSHEKNFDVRARNQIAELSSHLTADTILPKGLSLQAAKSYFPTEAQKASLGDFLRGKGNVAYKKLTDTWAETAMSTGLDVKCKAALHLDAKDILKLIVDHLKTNKSAEFLDTGKAIKAGVQSREGEKGSPVKDASSFTAAAFLLRVGPNLVGTTKEAAKALIGLQRLANDYSLGKPVDAGAKELLDSLSVALTGSKPKL